MNELSYCLNNRTLVAFLNVTSEAILDHCHVRSPTADATIHKLAKLAFRRCTSICSAHAQIYAGYKLPTRDFL